jgi:hypothetical protein
MATLTTPRYGFPYPDGAERVMDGDNAIGALALAIENYLSSVFRDLAPTYVRASAPLVLTQAEVLVPGMTVVLNASAAEVALVFASIDVNVTVAGAGSCGGQVYIGGVPRGGGSHYGPAATGRATIMSATTAALNPGNNTIEFRARKAGAGGTASIESVAALNAVSASTLAILRFVNQPALGALREALGDALDLPTPS